MSTTGKKANCLEIGNNAYSWEDEFNIAISGGALTNATAANFKVLKLNDAAPLCFYTGSGALTIAEFAAFPKGTIIFGIVVQKLYFKQTDATDSWKYASVAT